MLRVGLTGGPGAGKSIVSHLLQERAVPVVDVDLAGKWVVEHNPEVLAELLKTFGEDYFDAEGHLKRQRLGQTVFADPDALKALNRIVHPPMVDRVFQQVKGIEQQDSFPYLVVDAALLYELELHIKMHTVVTVYAPLHVCLQRLQNRDGLSERQALQRIRAQRPAEQKRDRADIVITNEGSLDVLKQQVEELHHKLLSLASQTP